MLPQFLESLRRQDHSDEVLPSGLARCLDEILQAVTDLGPGYRIAIGIVARPKGGDCQSGTAIAILEEVEGIFRELGNVLELAKTLVNRGMMTGEAGRADQALDLIRAGLQVAAEHGLSDLEHQIEQLLTHRIQQIQRASRGGSPWRDRLRPTLNPIRSLPPVRAPHPQPGRTTIRSRRSVVDHQMDSRLGGEGTALGPELPETFNDHGLGESLSDLAATDLGLGIQGDWTRPPGDPRRRAGGPLDPGHPSPTRWRATPGQPRSEASTPR